MKHKLRRLINDYHLMLAAIAILAAGIVCYFRWDEMKDKLVSLLIGIAGFVYFIQKQSLEETHLYYKLFCDFNQRYERVNDALMNMLDNVAEPRYEFYLLNDYFNLCGEEYHYYLIGHIHPKAWTTWCKGMVFYLDNSAVIRIRWQNEFVDGAYYGLTESIVREVDK